jgi:hypothetical protein
MIQSEEYRWPISDAGAFGGKWSTGIGVMEIAAFFSRADLTPCTQKANSKQRAVDQFVSAAGSPTSQERRKSSAAARVCSSDCT